MGNPDIKEMLKKEAKKSKEVAALRQKQQKQLETKLRIRTFLGFEFLSSSDSDEEKVVKPLKKPFRSFKEATLSYTSKRRLYKVEISDSVPGRSSTGIEAELTAMSAIFEKKYNFAFEIPLTSGGDFYTTGGGAQVVSGGDVRIARRKIVKKSWRSWIREYEWKDFLLVMEGLVPINGNEDTNTHVSVSFTMKGVPEDDRKESLKSASEDESGLDVL